MDLLAIDIEDLSFSYPDGTLALRDINLKIGKKTRLAILGSNGSGKSTLLRHLNGLLWPGSGSIKIDGLEVNKKNIKDIRKKVGIVFDNPDVQLFSTTVYEDMAFGLRNLGWEEDTIGKKLDKTLRLLGIENLRDRVPHNLSLGQKRKVAIGGVLAMEPDIMIFDEPFSGLDPISLRQFLDVLDELFDMGRTLVVTTHNVDLAYEWADQVIIINQGQILKQGTRELLEDRDLLRQANLSLPNLYHIFSSTDTRPHNSEEAKLYIDELYFKGEK